MRICPTCHTSYPNSDRSTCARDGTRLLEMSEYDALLHDPLIGRTVAGRFRVLERIGSGGMGTVYRAVQAGLGREVALKVLRKELVSDRDTVARFQREAKAMSLLVHPNTVRVFDFGEDEEEGHLFLAMELLEGELLTAWVEREGTPPLVEAIEVVRAILRSLSEAHRKGIIHRDLKPDNIVLARVEGQEHPVVKVLDFGIAKAFRDDRKIDQLETQAGTVFGTPRYMSPEQAQGKTLDHRSDLYSVGVLLYQLLAGQPPFLDDDAVVVMAKHIREAPPPLRTVVPDRPIPASLERTLMRALAKRPDERFESADAFEAALAACLPDIDGRKRSRFHALRIPLAIAAALLVASATAAIVWSTNAPTPDSGAAIAEPRPEPIASAPPTEPKPVITDVTLASEPSGAEIWRGEERIGVTPHTFSLTPAESIALTLRAPGRMDAEVELDASRGPVHTVELRPERRRAPRRARAPRSTPETDGPRTPAAPSRSDPYERFD